MDYLTPVKVLHPLDDLTSVSTGESLVEGTPLVIVISKRSLSMGMYVYKLR